VTLRAPFPWFGGKSRAASVIWRAFGNVPNYVEPFAGSLAVLLARPHAPKVETANDKDGFISNFWRAVQSKPDEVARWADWPVNEADLHARHAWLVKHGPELLEALITDPEYSDAKVAGWWVWGICCWIGNGWCSRDERLHRCMPKVGGPGHGIHAPTRQARKKPITHRSKGVNRMSAPPLTELFAELQARLRPVRICCGDWTRVLGRSTLGIDTPHGMTPAGVMLDPPYSHAGREKRLYRQPRAADRAVRMGRRARHAAGLDAARVEGAERVRERRARADLVLAALPSDRQPGAAVRGGLVAVRRSDLELLAELVAERLRPEIRAMFGAGLAPGPLEAECVKKVTSLSMDPINTEDDSASSYEEAARAVLQALPPRRRPRSSRRRSSARPRRAP
jgi:DNA adenine methylase